MKITKLSEIPDIMPQNEFKKLDFSISINDMVHIFKDFNIRKITAYSNQNYFIRTESWGAIDEPYPKRIKEILNFMESNDLGFLIHINGQLGTKKFQNVWGNLKSDDA